MKYQVREGCRVLWPDGTVRALAGEVFDGFDGRENERRAAYGRALLRGQGSAFDPAPADAEVTAGEPHGEFAELLNGGATFPPAYQDREMRPARAKKKTPKKKA